MVGNVYVAEEDDDVVVDVTFGVDAAEEANGVVDRFAGSHNDVAAELNSVAVTASGEGCEGGEEHEAGEKVSEIHGVSPGCTRKPIGKFRPDQNVGRKNFRLTVYAPGGKEKLVFR